MLYGKNDFPVSLALTKKVMMNDFVIKEGCLDDPRIINLLTIHVTRAHAETSPGKGHALDFNGLKAPEIKFFSIWERKSSDSSEDNEQNDVLLGMAAIKRIDDSLYEVKSMHTSEASRGKGIGSKLLKHLIETVRNLGAKHLSLETGSWPYFQPARDLYLKFGFRYCEPFANYTAHEDSVYMTLDL
jgi:putative acetyltransferase